VALGSSRCGVVNTPTRIRRNRQKIKTWDWFLEPSANVTTPSLSNLGFETAGLANWTIPSGSTWVRANAFTAAEGTYYAEGSTGDLGEELVMYRDLDTATIGMPNVDVDDGDFSLDFSVQIAGTSLSFVNTAKVYIEQYDSLGVTIKREETEWLTPDYQSWQGVGITSIVLPGCRTLRIGLINRIDKGSAGYVAFDDAKVRFWTNEASTWGGAVFRTVKIPSYASSERLAIVNPGFESNGVAVGNTNVSGAITGWTMTDYWQVVSSSGGLTPDTQSYFLMGGDNGSTTPNTEYLISQTNVLASAPAGSLAKLATTANINDGWYYCRLVAAVAKSDSDSAPRLKLVFKDSVGAEISNLDTGYITGLTEDVWVDRELATRVPNNTASIQVMLYARSGAAGSAANAAFDDVRLFFFPVAFEHVDDAETGRLAATVPTLDYGLTDMTVDGDAIVQAKALPFGYAAVTAVTDNRVFAASAINVSEENLYSGKIVWISGANAGRTSFIRIWNNTTKVAKLYDTLKGNIQVGDKFVYAAGCDKTISRCADGFGNAHNFRGEPYLPGPSRVIQFLSATEVS
jgi:hypothetical protein